jgi:membrane fusion protein (multidrug efflux system)
MEDKYQDKMKPAVDSPGNNPSSENQAGEEEQPINSVPLIRKKRVVIPLFILVAAAMVVAWYWYVNLREFVSTDDAYIDGNSVSLSTKILGKIKQLTVDEGDSVQVGQVLVFLDDSDLKAQEEQAKAVLKHSGKSVLLAKVNLEKTQEDYQRSEVLFKSGGTPKEEFDHNRKTYEAAQAQYNIALAQVSVAESQLGVIQTQLSNMTITSPLNGVIAKKWAMPGDIIQPGQPIFTIYDLKNIWVTANLEETKFSSIHLNDPVEISVDAYPAKHFKGKVIQLSSNTASQFSLIPPNNASGNFTKITQRIPVKISIENYTFNQGSNPTPLLPGMSAGIKIKVK